METNVLISVISLIISSNNLDHCNRNFVFTTEFQLGSFLQDSLMTSYIFNVEHNQYSVFIPNTISNQVSKFLKPCLVTFVQLEGKTLFKNSKELTIFQKSNNYLILLLPDLEINKILQNSEVFKYDLLVTLSKYIIKYSTFCPFGSNKRSMNFPTYPLDVNKPPKLWNSHQIFYKRPFRVSCPTTPIPAFEIRKKENKWKSVRGYAHFVFEHVMLKYNFTAIYFPSSGGGGTGNRLANGTWIGTVGDLLYGRADIAQITGQTYSRFQVVDFSKPMGYEWLTFVTGEGQPTYSWRSIYWPLSPICWLIILLNLITAFIIIIIFVKKTRKYSNVIGYLVRSILGQDRDISEKNSSVRVFTAFWLIFVLVISTAYRSKLVSLLAYPTLEVPPKTFPQLADNLNYQMSLQYIRGAAYALLKTSTSSTFKTIFKRMNIEEDPVKCFGGVLKKMEILKVAFLGTRLLVMCIIVIWVIAQI